MKLNSPGTVVVQNDHHCTHCFIKDILRYCTFIRYLCEIIKCQEVRNNFLLLSLFFLPYCTREHKRHRGTSGVHITQSKLKITHQKVTIKRAKCTNVNKLFITFRFIYIFKYLHVYIVDT